MLIGKKTIGTIGIMSGLPAVLEEFNWSLNRMLAYSHDYICGKDQRIEVVRSSHSFHSLARNNLVEQAQGDWLLQLDTDHSFEPDLLARLLHRLYKEDSEEYRIGNIAGLYLHKHPPYNPTLWGWTGVGEQAAYISDWPDDEILEVGVAGTGCLLTRSWVFGQIKERLNEDPFTTDGHVGEDFAFFRRCRKLNINTICDPTIECPHLKIVPLTLETHYPKEKR